MRLSSHGPQRSFPALFSAARTRAHCYADCPSLKLFENQCIAGAVLGPQGCRRWRLCSGRGRRPCLGASQATWGLQERRPPSAEEKELDGPWGGCCPRNPVLRPPPPPAWPVRAGRWEGVRLKPRDPTGPAIQARQPTRETPHLPCGQGHQSPPANGDKKAGARLWALQVESRGGPALHTRPSMSPHHRPTVSTFRKEVSLCSLQKDTCPCPCAVLRTLGGSSVEPGRFPRGSAR